MKFYAALFGAAVLLSGVGVAHAQTDLDSKVTVAFTLHVTTDTGSTDADTKIVKVRLNTKDLLEAVNAANTTGTANAIVLRRDAVISTTTPPTAFLTQDLVFVDTTATPDAVVAITPATLDETAGPVLAAENTNTASADKDDAGTLLARKVLQNEAVRWLFDTDGAGAGVDVITIDMLAAETLSQKRKTSGGTDLGLWFSSRSADIHGGMDGITAAAGDDGYMEGSVRAGPEKVRQ